MNNKLYELYLEGFEKGYFDIFDVKGRVVFSWHTNREWEVSVTSEEESHYCQKMGATPEETYESEEFQTARKRWDEIQASPLMRALE